MGCANNGDRTTSPAGLGTTADSSVGVPEKGDCVSAVAVTFITAYHSQVHCYHNNPNRHDGKLRDIRLGSTTKLPRSPHISGFRLNPDILATSFSGVTPTNTPRQLLAKTIFEVRLQVSKSGTEPSLGRLESPKQQRGNLHLPTCPPRAPVILMPLSSRFFRYLPFSLLA